MRFRQLVLTIGKAIVVLVLLATNTGCLRSTSELTRRTLGADTVRNLELPVVSAGSTIQDPHPHNVAAFQLNSKGEYYVLDRQASLKDVDECLEHYEKGDGRRQVIGLKAHKYLEWQALKPFIRVVRDHAQKFGLKTITKSGSSHEQPLTMTFSLRLVRKWRYPGPASPMILKDGDLLYPDGGSVVSAEGKLKVDSEKRKHIRLKISPHTTIQQLAETLFLGHKSDIEFVLLMKTQHE